MAVAAVLRNGISGGFSRFGAFRLHRVKSSLPEIGALNDPEIDNKASSIA
jgi:hypothetical protein